MKNKFLTILILVVGSFFVVSAVQAQGGYLTETTRQLKAAAGDQGANFGTPNDPRLVVAYVIRIMLGTFGIVFVAYTVYAGFLLINSRGNEEDITKARNIMRNGVLGTIIVMSSYGITLLVSYYLTYPSPSDDVLYMEYQHEIESELPDFYGNNPNDPYNEQQPNPFAGSDWESSQDRAGIKF